MNRYAPPLAAAALLAFGTVAPAAAGTTVVTSGSGVAVVSSGTHIVVGDVVVGKGPAKTEDRKTGAYTSLVLEAPVEMSYKVAAFPTLKVTAPANILAVVTTDVKGRSLTIGLRKSVTMDGAIVVEATGPSLEEVTVNGSGSLNIAGASGRKLAIEVSGSGSVAVSGQVDRAEFEISGSGEVSADKLRSQDLTVDVSGSGTVTGYASRSAKVDVSGSGDITIAGNPKQRSVERSGSGEVTFR